MANYEKEFDDARKANKTIDLLREYGEVEAITVEAEVDIDALLEGVDTGRTPQEPSDGSESEGSREVGKVSATDEESDESEGESREVDSEAHRPLYCEMGQRGQEIVDMFLHSGNGWLTADEFEEEMGGSPAQAESNVYSSALSNHYRRNTTPLERRKGEPTSGGGRAPLEYRLIPEAAERLAEEKGIDFDQSPSEEDETESEAEEPGQNEGKEEYEDVPGSLRKRTNQHLVLAALSQLTTGTDKGYSADQISEKVPRGTQKVRTALSELKKKSLAKQKRVEGSMPGEPGPDYKWRPTKAGEAELDRIGGYQLNSGAAGSDD